MGVPNMDTPILDVSIMDTFIISVSIIDVSILSVSIIDVPIMRVSTLDRDTHSTCTHSGYVQIAHYAHVSRRSPPAEALCGDCSRSLLPAVPLRQNSCTPCAPCVTRSVRWSSNWPHRRAREAEPNRLARPAQEDAADQRGVLLGSPKRCRAASTCGRTHCRLLTSFVAHI